MAVPESLSDRPVIVLSPHLGDAALGCGYLLSQLARSTPVTVMTLFTHSRDDSPTRPARSFLDKRNARRAPALYAQRRAEDSLALRSIEVTPVHFGLHDALFRRRTDRNLPKVVRNVLPELSVVYPTYRWHIVSGVLSPLDFPLVDELVQRVLLATTEDDVILAPLGLSGNVDRVLTHQVGLALARSDRHVGFYADQPDAQNMETEVPTPEGTERLKFDVDQTAKAQFLERYSTHVRSELGKRIPVLDETVFLPASL
ncbi:PIG-L family deacetylase [Kineosporia babensis]|uniref:PIG-L family deacetylase n=1 Tax=Kineosporia babensis TaxID=499548 RepID=A0A9X1NNI1_9ACTN|nr:PIG-L family deacetylase [Kineosporia babensis]MCD5316729.1 PIG-L family deacetylase [Kineosporia babensis]